MSAIFNRWLATELFLYGLFIACFIGFIRFRITSSICLMLLILLTVLALPVSMEVYPATVHTQTRHKLWTIMVAMHNFAIDFQKFPKASINSVDGKPLLSWRVAILPYLGQEELFRKFKLNEPWDSPHNIQLLSLMPEDYRVSKYTADLEKGHTLFVAVVGPDTFISTSEAFPYSKFDKEQASYTAVLTLGRKSVPWTAPFDLSSAVTLADVSPVITFPSPFPIVSTFFQFGYSMDAYPRKVIQIGFAEGSVHSASIDRLQESNLFPQLFKIRKATTEELKKLSQLF